MTGCIGISGSLQIPLLITTNGKSGESRNKKKRSPGVFQDAHDFELIAVLLSVGIVIRFLLSDESSFMTGQTVVASGGRVSERLSRNRTHRPGIPRAVRFLCARAIALYSQQTAQ